ncbi:hypothetical protein J2S03_001660 [Alicyclobacillus cycloheptanicus]|uniref:Transposase n=1 Tax=Alicyclobacillus cycloheptanicus TaxID=1457 RepID=A0ABT9XJ48_9BACL|nr:hypothetical protein [Alicyclobacillus cycloheptanicus]
MEKRERQNSTHHQEAPMIGVDISKLTHVARSLHVRGLGLGGPLYFENTRAGLEGLGHWLENP